MSKNQMWMLVIIIGFLSIGAVIPKYGKQTVETLNDYVPEDFYRGYNSDEPLDFRRIYGEHTGSKFQGAKACGVNDVPISRGKSPYKPDTERGLFWFWSMSEIEEGVLTSGKDIGEGRTLFEVKPSTELIAIGDGALVSKTQYPLNMYPDAEYTPGVHLGYIVKLPEEKTAFRITYSSMEKWWVCQDKVEADEYFEDKVYQPKYYVGKTFTDDKEFYSGTVVGYSGQSGIPISGRGETKSYLIVKVERAVLSEEGAIDSEWTLSSVSDLY